MIWLIIPAFILLVAAGLLLLPVECVVDTRIPALYAKWAILKVTITYLNNEWRLCYSILFFKNTVTLARKAQPASKKNIATGKKKATSKRSLKIKKMWRVIKTVRVTRWQLALDTGDWVVNGWLYPLNFLPALQHHVCINFKGENYLFLRLKCIPLQALLALIK